MSGTSGAGERSGAGVEPGSDEGVRVGVARRMTAMEQLRAGRTGRRLPQLLAGLVGYGVSIMVLVTAGLGPTSWSVLTEGIVARTPLSFGWATNLVAVVVLLTWIPLRELPGLGTVLNVVLIGLAADATALVLPHPGGLPGQVGYLLAGLLLLAFSDALYLGARFGSGPRDGLMTGLVRLTGRPVWQVRTGLEVAVCAVGWALGGTLGVGTLVLAFALGPLIGWFLPRLTVRLPGE